MATQPWREPSADDPVARKTLAFIQEVLRDCHPRNFAIELWAGTHWDPEPGQFRRFAWKICRPGAVRAAFASLSELSLAEAYIYGDFDFEGDLEGVFALTDYLLNRGRDAQEKARLGAALHRLPPGLQLRPVHAGARLQGLLHSKERDRLAFSYHYDISNDFYGLWLGKEMAYSSGYFRKPEDERDAAQKQKLDYICHQLRLQAGERLLDIGCGWGGLILHAVREHGVNALGITVSSQQHKFIEDRIRETGLTGRCQVKLLDYRDLPAPDAYDKIVSRGMTEHVGGDNLVEFFTRSFRALRPGGMFLLQASVAPEGCVRDKRGFTETYVMPDSEIGTLGSLIRAAESAGFEVRDVENLREHLLLTIRHWARCLEAHAEQARRLIDEVTYRIWRLHLAQNAYALQSGQMGLFQVVLVKHENGNSGLPLLREEWRMEGPREKTGPREAVVHDNAPEWTP